MAIAAAASVSSQKQLVFMTAASTQIPLIPRSMPASSGALPTVSFEEILGLALLYARNLSTGNDRQHKDFVDLEPAQLWHRERLTRPLPRNPTRPLKIVPEVAVPKDSTPNSTSPLEIKIGLYSAIGRLQSLRHNKAEKPRLERDEGHFTLNRLLQNL